MTFRHRLKIYFALVSALFLAGCQAFDSNSTGSVTFRVTAEMVQQLKQIQGNADCETAPLLSARAVTPEELQNVFFDISLKGGYTDKKSIPAAEGSSAIFSGIPVGTIVWAECVAYRVEKNDDGTIGSTPLFTGKSEATIIKEGENGLTIQMQRAGALSISVVIHPTQDEILLSQRTEGTKIVLTAKVGDADGNPVAESGGTTTDGTAFCWYVDGKKQETTDATFTLETDGMSEGIYEIEVAYGDKSVMATVTIE